jgi:hypothetical protein
MGDGPGRAAEFCYSVTFAVAWSLAELADGEAAAGLVGRMKVGTPAW